MRSNHDDTITLSSRRVDHAAFGLANPELHRARCKRPTLLMPIAALRPTQGAVGMMAVEYKRHKLADRLGRPKKIKRFLDERPIPSVIGPGGEVFIVDHHHLGLALLRADIDSAVVQVIADLSALSRPWFFKEMEASGHLYPFDEAGRRLLPSRLPKRLHALRHDPYRDLAWSVREAGAFKKSAAPFAEFRWAEFFRERISLLALKRDYRCAVKQAVMLAATAKAGGLPGYIAR